MPTFLPYITDGSTFSIRLLPGKDPVGSDHLHSPFVVISESGAFTRILKAEIISDHRSIVTPVFLLMGKDSYHLTGSEQELLNNDSIDQCWQRAYSYLSKDSQLITLAEQAGDDSILKQFQPLFFCREKEVFFHPPCPQCGTPVALCTDDDLLGSLGLQVYTKSLSRYLYCEDCHKNNRPVDFYSYLQEPTDPHFVKNLHGLIDGFRLLTQTAGDGFPCLKCPLHSECYSGENLAQDRIVPFSFYPFHLLVLTSPSINAMDFLALISGATLEDIRARMDRKTQLSRLWFVKSVCKDTTQASPLLFEGDARSFLELFYLKLSFLGQLARIVFFDAETLRYPDLATTLDRIWVDLRGKDSLLPYFWNFHARFIDIGQSSTANHDLLKMPPTYASYLMGTLWFQTLLSNSLHTPEEVSAALAEHLHRTDALNSAVDEGAGMENHAHLFSPDNIFWNPTDREPDQEWLELWAEALGLGWALLKSSVASDFTLTEDAFWQSFDRLRQDIRESMFLSADKAAPENQDISNDSAIHAILHDIMDQWSKPSADIPDDEDQTIIVSGRASPGSDEEVTEETVLLKPGQRTAQLQKGEEDVLETVILSSQDVAPSQPPHYEPEIPETVIIKTGQADRQKPAEDLQQDAESGNREEELEATVILQKETSDETVIMKPPSQQPPVEDGSDEEDLLEETVILSPHRDKD